MNIENLIVGLWKMNSDVLKPYDFKFIESVGMRLSYDQIGMTEKQANLALKILKKNVDVLNDFYRQDVMPFIVNPTYQYPLRTIDSVKSISLIKDPGQPVKIKCKFPFDETVINAIKKNKGVFFEALWNPEDKFWSFSLQHETIKFCKDLVEQNSFQIDPEFQVFFDQINDIHQNLEKYVPMVDVVDEKLTIINSPSEKIDIKSQNILEFLIAAKFYGIKTWSNQVDQILHNSGIDQVCINFIKHDENELFSYNFEENGEESFLKLIKNFYPCLIFIPAGSELSKTHQILNLLNKNDVKNQEISTLFRLSNDTNSSFNKFIKENHLNSPISENTKAVLVSQKIPKTIFQSGIKFKLAIVFSKFYAHYQTKDYLKNFPNIIEIYDKNAKTNNDKTMEWILDV